MYENYMRAALKEEVIMADITKNDRVLHIGCGFYPITAILLSNKTGASVTGIDRNQNAIQVAEKHLQKRNIKNVEVKYGDGINYSGRNFDVIIITSSVTPIIKVLKNILKNSDKDCKIICREFITNKDAINQSLNDSFDVTLKKIKQKSGWNSYLILKNS